MEGKKMKIMKLPEDLDMENSFKSQDGTLIAEIEINKEYSLAYGELQGKESSKPHTMTMKELYYILEGKGIITVNNTEHSIVKGDVVIIPENAVQKMTNTGKKKLKFLMIVNPPYDPEKEIIFE